MLDQIDLNQSLEKNEYKKVIDKLELKIGALQREARELNIPVIIVFEGWDGAGKGTLINKLILPLDPRGFTVHLTHTSTNDEETMRPFLWRYWNKTPERGRICIYDRSWYRRVLEDRINKELPKNKLAETFNEINHFERQLCDDGNVIVKFLIHVSKKIQKKRIKEIEENPSTSWRISDKAWEKNKQYKQYYDAFQHMLENSDTDYAPWTVIEAHDRRFAEIKILNTVIEALSEAVKKAKNKVITDKKATTKTPVVKLKKLDSSFLDKFDLTKKISEKEYREQIETLQEEVRDIEYRMYKKRVPLICVFEGWDGAGKGGAIKRLTQKMDPRGYNVFPFAAPNATERAHHYLWRFWQKVPKAGHIAIFDRSWYGRVLVERVEGFCKENEWKRAYKEITEFEEQMVDNGTVITKFWLQIDKDEQLRRFKERKKLEHKQWKITDEDWRNREKWGQYEEAVDEMLLRTSTSYAPWTVVEANDKYYARIKVLKTVINAMKDKV